MSLAVGIDVGAYKCAVAVCHKGEREAERKVLTITTQRGGFTHLDGWMERQGAPIDVVVMESSGHSGSTWRAICAARAIRWRW